MKQHKSAICFVILLLLMIAVLVYCVYYHKPIKKESGYLQGSWYLTTPPDPYPNFPDGSL